MNLKSGRHIYRTSLTELPISDYFINHVKSSVAKDKNRIKITFRDRNLIEILDGVDNDWINPVIDTGVFDIVANNGIGAATKDKTDGNDNDEPLEPIYKSESDNNEDNNEPDSNTANGLDLIQEPVPVIGGTALIEPGV